MGIIMINCPATGRGVSTGIETVGIEELPAVTAKMVCPACGRVHDWTRSSETSRSLHKPVRPLKLRPEIYHICVKIPTLCL